MDDTIQVTLAANAGVLLAYRGRKLLVDGLFHAENIPFSNLPPETLRALYGGRPPYDGIDYLLFTHGHPDHFSREMLEEYLAETPVKGVLLPPSRKPAHVQFEQELRARGVPCGAAPLSGPTEITLEPDLRVRSIPTRHLDRKFWDVPHAALLLTLGTKRLLFTGDTDYTAETCPTLPPLRAVFLNPLFFHAYCSGKFFHGRFPTETICVYHVPFPEDDAYHVQELLARDLTRCSPENCSVEILRRPNQQIDL